MRAPGSRPRPSMGFLRVLLVLFLLGTQAWAAEGVATLKYSYRDETGRAELFRDPKGSDYFSLMDVARFYGMKISFDPALGRVTLSKGERRVRFALGHQFLLLGEERDAYPMDPAVLVSGQLGITPDTVKDILCFILNLNVQYIEDESVVVAGGVRAEDVRKEILAALKTPPVDVAPTPTPDRLAGLPAATPGQRRKVARVTLEPPGERAYRVRKIVIDAGHGGRDGGACGSSRRYLEKDVTLDIAKRVAEILADEPGFEVLMTRKKDVYLSLKDRTDFANKHNADLFVSIHANANPNRRATGTETYVYSSHSSDKVASVAAFRENADANLMDFIQDDLRHSAYRSRSFLLAEMIDQRIRDRLGQKIRRIEQAPFYVLARVDMPSVLIETAFLSNPQEEKKLRDPDWRDRMAHTIADGILAYREQVEDAQATRRERKKH